VRRCLVRVNKEAFTSTPMGFVAILVLIALSGMIIRNSVILIDQIDMDLARGLHPWDAVVDATTHRLRPIVLTAAAASLGMIPIASEVFWGPMAYAIIGGLFVATLLTLLFTAGPLCYLVPHQGAAKGARTASRSGCARCRQVGSQGRRLRDRSAWPVVARRVAARVGDSRTSNFRPLRLPRRHRLQHPPGVQRPDRGVNFSPTIDADQPTVVMMGYFSRRSLAHRGRECLRAPSAHLPIQTNILRGYETCR